MISTPEEFLNLVTVNKDRNLGKYEREMSEAMFQDIMDTYLEMPLLKEQATSLFDKIHDYITEYNIENDKIRDLSNKTNVEVHFVIQDKSLVQYISPYIKDYNVGNTRQLIKENVIWALRPEAITIGEHYELTTNKGRNHSLKEINRHKDGECKEMFNVIALHTYELYSKENIETSTVHIAVYYPVGSIMWNSIVALYQKKQSENSKRLIPRQAPPLLRKMSNPQK